MNNLKTIENGGFPINLNDIRWIFGQDTYTGGIYQVLNNMLRQLGDNFIVYGCADLGANIGAGLIMLDGELIYVDQHAWTDSYFVKVITYDSDGLKVFQDATPPSGHDTYEKVRATVTAGSGSLNWNIANVSGRFEHIVKTQISNFISTKRETIKGRSINFPNVTEITLTATKKIILTSGAGNMYVVKSDGSTHVTLEKIEDSVTFASSGEEILLHIKSTSDPILINSGSGTSDITTPKGTSCIVQPDTIIRLQSHNNSWIILSTSKPLLDVPYIDMSGVTTYTKTVKKIIEIGAWNMVSTEAKGIPHGLTDIMKVVSIACMIKHDNSTTNLINLESMHMTSNGLMNGSIIELDATQIFLKRYDGGLFNSVGYDDGTMNRGWVIIEYML